MEKLTDRQKELIQEVVGIGHDENGNYVRSPFICKCIRETLKACNSETTNDGRKKWDEVDISNPDVFDEFYSLALETVCKDVRNYKEGKNTKFSSYIWTAIGADIRLELKKQHAYKRISQRTADSIDREFGDGNGTVGDFIKYDKDDYYDKESSLVCEKVMSYLNPYERQVTELYVSGMTISEIAKKLKKSRRAVEYVINYVWKSPYMLRLKEIYLNPRRENR